MAFSADTWRQTHAILDNFVFLMLPEKLRLEFAISFSQHGYCHSHWSVISILDDFLFLRLPLGFSPASLF
jgi:hypothetical protein